jgi:hypothetical protein
VGLFIASYAFLLVGLTIDIILKNNQFLENDAVINPEEYSHEQKIYANMREKISKVNM